MFQLPFINGSFELSMQTEIPMITVRKFQLPFINGSFELKPYNLHVSFPEFQLPFINGSFEHPNDSCRLVPLFICFSCLLSTALLNMSLMIYAGVVIVIGFSCLLSTALLNINCNIWRKLQGGRFSCLLSTALLNWRQLRLP